ncbi:hypothetical protein Y048_4264 [Burkholderia pseudomallei MSHR456]|nr:hypothetical protein Y048_4264 [Burkholderia pseudomallei MSHR456]
MRILVTAAPTVRSSNQGIATPVFPVRKTSPAPKRVHVGRGVSSFLNAPSSLLIGREQTHSRPGGLSGVRCPHVLIASHCGKPQPIVWISHCPGVLKVDHCVLDLLQKKAASKCGPDIALRWRPKTGRKEACERLALGFDASMTR